MPPKSGNNEEISELIDKFWDLYQKIRDDTLLFEVENPADFRFAGALIAEQRNAIDYYALGYTQKRKDVLQIAIKSLQESGIDVLEFIFIQKIKRIDNYINEQNGLLKRLIYPSSVKDYLIGSMRSLMEHLQKGRTLKPLGYDESASEFKTGINLAQKVIEEYESRKIPGMRKGERRYNWIITFIIGVAVGVLGTLIKLLLGG